MRGPASAGHLQAFFLSIERGSWRIADGNSSMGASAVLTTNSMEGPSFGMYI
jgi:hypothetical protein